MTSKALLAAATAGLTYASHLALPAPYGALVAAALAGVAYVANHDALIAAVAKIAKVGLVAVALVACACSHPPTPAQAAQAARLAKAACVLERAGGMPEAPAADVARQFCSSAAQLAPYAAALADAGAP